MTSASARDTGNALCLGDLGSVERMLVLHSTDRWYFGDFLRHACWLGWAARNLPGVRVDLATHSAYLPMYRDGRFGSMVDVETVVPGDLAGYDLVVEPISFPVTEPPAADIRRLLRTWDRGWALYAHGREVARGAKDELNYFRAAHPVSLSLPDVSGDMLAAGTPISFTDAERHAARAVLDGIAPGDGPVLVYNPTASNAFTRETSAVKEVDNTLTVGEHAAVLRQIALGIKSHDVLVAAPVKPADARNTAVVRSVAATVGCGLVTTSLREFAALLADPRVCSAVGGGTGSNTHLAALIATWSLSIERAADAAMRANWSRPEAFQMGSFRWRNPSRLTAVHTMAWDGDDERATEVRVAGAAQAFLTHHVLAHGAHEELFDRQRTRIGELHCWAGSGSVDMQLSRALTAWMTSSARAHLGDFADEIAYLRYCSSHPLADCPGSDLDALLAAADAGSVTDPAMRTLAEQLFRDSNLDKIVSLMTDPAGRRPTPDHYAEVAQ